MTAARGGDKTDDDGPFDPKMANEIELALRPARHPAASAGDEGGEARGLPQAARLREGDVRGPRRCPRIPTRSASSRRHGEQHDAWVRMSSDTVPTTSDHDEQHDRLRGEGPRRSGHEDPRRRRGVHDARLPAAEPSRVLRRHGARTSSSSRRAIFGGTFDQYFADASRRRDRDPQRDGQAGRERPRLALLEHDAVPLRRRGLREVHGRPCAARRRRSRADDRRGNYLRDATRARPQAKRRLLRAPGAAPRRRRLPLDEATVEWSEEMRAAA